jgi:hypothetical protein
MIIPGKNSGIIDITNKFILKEIILEMLLNYKCGDAPTQLNAISHLWELIIKIENPSVSYFRKGRD